MNYGGYFDVSKKEEVIKELEEETKKSTFWDDRDKAEETVGKISSIKKSIDPLKEAKQDIEFIREMIKLEDVDNETLGGLDKQISEIDEKLSNVRLELLFNGKYDSENCILEIHPGAGGTESCDWASMLYRMYTRWCEKNNYKINVLDYQAGDEAGLKSVSILIKGNNAYGHLRSEKGIHRLVRLSPFDSNNRRHTSFASVEVTPDIKKNIDINIDDKDLKIDVYRSTGAGGQGVNTTDSAVRITHLPTKIVVTCQNERSQIQNKEQALQVLKSKLLLLEEQKQENELNKVKGVQSNIDFGSQIRSYVMHPYSMAKDHRTNVETSNVSKVMDGDIDMFIEAYLKEGV